MTLDEAIKHCEEVAEKYERHLNIYENMDDDLFRVEKNECKNCAKEHRQLAEWLKELKQLKEQEPCEDAVSRQTVLETIDDCNSDGLKGIFCSYNDGERFKEYIKKLPPVTPTHIETVTEFADKCRECGKTAITRAENDEILNEAWRLLMDVTEEDGVSVEQARGMLKLMTFFFYKYHGLKKKPEWVENVEARLALIIQLTKVKV